MLKYNVKRLAKTPLQELQFRNSIYASRNRELALRQRELDVITQQLEVHCIKYRAIFSVHTVQLSDAEDQQQARLEGALVMARTVTHELSQLLTTLQFELDFVTEFGEIPNTETFERLQSLTHQVIERTKKFRSIRRYQQVEFGGTTILDIDNN